MPGVIGEPVSFAVFFSVIRAIHPADRASCYFER